MRSASWLSNLSTSGEAKTCCILVCARTSTSMHMHVDTCTHTHTHTHTHRQAHRHAFTDCSRPLDALHQQTTSLRCETSVFSVAVSPFKLGTEQPLHTAAIATRPVRARCQRRTATLSPPAPCHLFFPARVSPRNGAHLCWCLRVQKTRVHNMV